jgi:hypothetical protein
MKGESRLSSFANNPLWEAQATRRIFAVSTLVYLYLADKKTARSDSHAVSYFMQPVDN